MRIVIQRVRRASVSIGGNVHSEICKGLLILLGIEKEDSASDIDYLVTKLCSVRIFPDSEDKMNLDIRQAGGELMIISQFTLHASTRKGNRPSFIKAASPDQAIPLYDKFISEASASLGKECRAGVFGANMRVELINDGPVTIIIDSKQRE